MRAFLVCIQTDGFRLVRVRSKICCSFLPKHFIYCISRIEAPVHSFLTRDLIIDAFLTMPLTERDINIPHRVATPPASKTPQNNSKLPRPTHTPVSSPTATRWTPRLVDSPVSPERLVSPLRRTPINTHKLGIASLNQKV